jgi:signal transduction histidine kinase
MRLHRSLSFRLALLYMCLLCGSVLVIGGVQYWFTVRAPMSTVEQRVQAEAELLASLHRQAGGVDALAAALGQRASAGGARLPYHALIAPDGTVLTANLPGWPRVPGARWLRLDADIHAEGDRLDHEALTLDVSLDDGTRLLVGRDIEDIDEIEEKLLTAVVGVVGATLLLGLAGGVLMAMVIGRRIAAVTRAARQVMDGDLSGRIPLHGSQDDFERLGATLNEMLARIERLFESVRRVSDNVAHELRTPLTRLRARLESLRASGEIPSGPAADQLTAEVEGLDKTFDAVLRIARIEGCRDGAAMARVDMSALLEDAADLYGVEAERRGLSVQTGIAKSLAVTGDRDLLFQSVCNLLDNAVKYTPRGGRISLTARRAGSHIEILVCDDGPGIPECDRDRVTERFYRVAATSAAPGAGLGLSLVAAVAERHDSLLSFEDGSPGLTVRWSLPADHAAATNR